MAEEQIGAASVSVGMDASPVLQELEKMRQSVESKISAMALAMNAPFYLAVRSIQGIMSGLESVITAPFRALSTGIDAVLGPAREKMANSLLDIGHWTAAAREAEVNQTRFNAVFKASGDVIGYTAKELANMRTHLMEQTGFGGGAIRQAQQQLIQLRDVRGENFFRALELSANLAARSGGELADVASTIGRALVNPEHGMRRLRHEGIMLTDAEQQLIKQAGAGGDVFQQQSVMLGILEKKVGDVAAAMTGTAENKIQRFSNAWNYLGKTIWGFIVPLQGAFAEVMSTIVRTVTEAIGPTFGSFTEKTKAFADATSDWLKRNKETFMLWAELGKNIIGNVVTQISDWLGKLFGVELQSTATEFWSKMSEGITKFLGLLAAGSENFGKFWDVLKIEGQILWQEMLDYAIPVWNQIGDAIVGALSKAWDKVMAYFYDKLVDSAWFKAMLLAEQFTTFGYAGPFARIASAAAPSQAPSPSGAMGPPAPADLALRELVERRDELLAKGMENVAKTIVDTSKEAFKGKTGSTDYGPRTVAGGIVGIEALSRAIQEDILKMDYAKQTADNTEKMVEQLERLNNTMSGSAGPQISLDLAARFA